MQNVKSPNADHVISYEGTGFDDPTFEAEEKPFADAGLSQAEYDALPNYDSVGYPWHSPPPPVLTPEEKVAKMLQNHELTLSDLKTVLGA